MSLSLGYLELCHLCDTIFDALPLQIIPSGSKDKPLYRISIFKNSDLKGGTIKTLLKDRTSIKNIKIYFMFYIFTRNNFFNMFLGEILYFINDFDYAYKLF
jgi:hypothetical protein